MQTIQRSPDLHATSSNVAGDLPAVSSDWIEGTTGHVVIVEGEGETRDRAVAVWHVSPTGRPTGAWITPVSVLSNDVGAAETLLRLTARRALFAWDAEAALPVLDQLTEWAKHSGTLRPPTAMLPQVLTEIAEHRRAHASAVDEFRGTARSKIAPLVWRRDVPISGSWQDLVEAVPLRRPDAPCPVAADALHLVKAAAWAAELWYQTEIARCRRTYLVERFGPASMLPAGWVEQLRAAHHNWSER